MAEFFGQPLLLQPPVLAVTGGQPPGFGNGQPLRGGNGQPLRWGNGQPLGGGNGKPPGCFP